MYLAIRAIVYGVMLSTFLGNSSVGEVNTVGVRTTGFWSPNTWYTGKSRPTCQAADELLLSVLVEQVRAKDQFQALVAGFTCARCQHLVQQRHLLVTDPTDTGQSVFDEPQDLPEDRADMKTSLKPGN